MQERITAEQLRGAINTLTNICPEKYEAPSNTASPADLGCNPEAAMKNWRDIKSVLNEVSPGWWAANDFSRTTIADAVAAIRGLKSAGTDSDKAKIASLEHDVSRLSAEVAVLKDFKGKVEAALTAAHGGDLYASASWLQGTFKTTVAEDAANAITKLAERPAVDAEAKRRLNFKAAAWQKVFDVLCEVSPGWNAALRLPMPNVDDMAVTAIRGIASKGNELREASDAVGDDTKQQAKAWNHVVGVLNGLLPNWLRTFNGSGMQCAEQAIRHLAKLDHPQPELPKAILRELDRRLPGWRVNGKGTDRAVSAIRALSAGIKLWGNVVEVLDEVDSGWQQRAGDSMGDKAKLAIRNLLDSKGIDAKSVRAYIHAAMPYFRAAGHSTYSVTIAERFAYQAASRDLHIAAERAELAVKVTPLPAPPSLTDAQCDSIMAKLDDWAMDVDSNNYGLPNYSEYLHDGREAIRSALNN